MAAMHHHHHQNDVTHHPRAGVGHRTSQPQRRSGHERYVYDDYGYDYGYDSNDSRGGGEGRVDQEEDEDDEEEEIVFAEEDHGGDDILRWTTTTTTSGTQTRTDGDDGEDKEAGRQQQRRTAGDQDGSNDVEDDEVRRRRRAGALRDHLMERRRQRRIQASKKSASLPVDPIRHRDPAGGLPPSKDGGEGEDDEDDLFARVLMSQSQTQTQPHSHSQSRRIDGSSQPRSGTGPRSQSQPRPGRPSDEDEEGDVGEDYSHHPNPEHRFDDDNGGGEEEVQVQVQVPVPVVPPSSHDGGNADRGIDVDDVEVGVVGEHVDEAAGGEGEKERADATTNEEGGGGGGESSTAHHLDDADEDDYDWNQQPEDDFPDHDDHDGGGAGRRSSDTRSRGIMAGGEEEMDSLTMRVHEDAVLDKARRTTERLNRLAAAERDRSARERMVDEDDDDGRGMMGRLSSLEDHPRYQHLRRRVQRQQQQGKRGQFFWDHGRTTAQKTRKRKFAKVQRDDTRSVKSTKSIVGSRPSHWAPSNLPSNGLGQRRRRHLQSSTQRSQLSQATMTRTPRGTQSSSSTQRLGGAEDDEFGRQRRLRRAADLARAAATPSLVHRNPHNKRHRVRGNAKEEEGTDGGGDAPPPPRTAARPTPGVGDRWIRNLDVGSMSFGPSFLRDKSGNRNDGGATDDIVETSQRRASEGGREDDDGDDGARHKTPLHGPDVPDDGGNDDPLSALRHFAPSAGRHRNGGGSSRVGGNGPLMRRLRRLRSEAEGDAARLRSGAYPFRPPGTPTTRRDRQRDVNDPRNRARMHVDVTVVRLWCPPGDGGWQPAPRGRSPRGGASGASDVAAWALGYVHGVMFATGDGGRIAEGSKSKSNDRRSTPCQRMLWERDDGGGVDEKIDHHRSTPSLRSFAWICFRVDTVREHGISEGTQLRIYDCVRVSVSVAVGMPAHRGYDRRRGGDCQRAPGGEGTALAGEAVYDAESSSIPILLCTRLCEPYPSMLPPLELPPVVSCAERKGGGE